jgi:hypothetical protein
MSTIGGPDIITDGLILSLDAANTKSYPGSGTNYNDISGNGIVATLANTPTINTDGTITLDGVNQYIEVVSDGTTKGFDTQNFTIDFWCNLISDGSYEVLWSYDYTSHTTPYYAQHIRTNNGNSQMAMTCNNGVGESSANGAVNFGAWQHWTWVRDLSAGTTGIYIDGQFNRQDSGETNTIDYYAQEVWIGRANFSSGYLKGTLGPYKFYNRPLSAAEILQNHNAIKSRFGL